MILPFGPGACIFGHPRGGYVSLHHYFQAKSIPMENILSYVDANKQRYLDELKSFLAIPSVSSQSDHNKDTRDCAEWVAEEMRREPRNT